jgi:hypothetical protein
MHNAIPPSLALSCRERGRWPTKFHCSGKQNYSYAVIGSELSFNFPFCFSSLISCATCFKVCPLKAAWRILPPARTASVRPEARAPVTIAAIVDKGCSKNSCMDLESTGMIAALSALSVV